MGDIQYVEKLIRKILWGQQQELAVLEELVKSGVQDTARLAASQAQIGVAHDQIQKAMDCTSVNDVQHIEQMLKEALTVQRYILLVMGEVVQFSIVDNARLQALSAHIQSTTAQIGAVVDAKQPGAVLPQGNK